MLQPHDTDGASLRAKSSTDEGHANRELAKLAKALGHPLRVQIVKVLAQRESCVCGELVSELPVAQSTVSQHLKILKDAGLIRGTIDGPRVCYCLEPTALARLKELVSDLPELASPSGDGTGPICTTNVQDC